MNLHQAGGTAAQAALQASSRRGMHTTRRRDSLMVKRWLKRASEPSRAKQGTQTPECDLRRSAWDRQALRGGVLSVGGGLRLLLRGDAKRKIQHAFEFSGPVREAVVARSHVVARLEELVGDIERGEHGNFEAVALRALPHGQPHLFIHVRSEFGHVALLERAADGVSLAVNLDVDDALSHLHQNTDWRLTSLPRRSAQREGGRSQIQRLDLLQHVVHARADEVAFLSQRGNVCIGRVDV
jgi:hypothetical protein